MDYEKKYKEALERAKNFIENGDERERTIAESIFAGIMEESEDERIRKKLIDYFKENNAALAFEGISNESVLAWLEKQCEQKPAEWREEDEYFQYVLINECVGKTYKENAINWLKSLKDRVHPKQDVMSEDEFAHTVGYLVQDVVANEHMPEGEKQPTKYFVEKYYSKLRPQPKWKPSEEQLGVLASTTRYGVTNKKILQSLYMDLKKLTE